MSSIVNGDEETAVVIVDGSDDECGIVDVTEIQFTARGNRGK